MKEKSKKEKNDSSRGEDGGGGDRKTIRTPNNQKREDGYMGFNGNGSLRSQGTLSGGEKVSEKFARGKLLRPS